MPTFYLNKLVRDKIVAHMQSAGQQVQYAALQNEDLQKALMDKLVEEAKEVQTAPADELLDELADVQEVLQTIMNHLNVTPEQLEEAQRLKRNKNGGFKAAIFVETVTLRDDDPWIDTYSQKFRQ